MRTQTGENGQNRTKTAGEGPGNGSDVVTGLDQVLTSREARAFLKIGRTKLHDLTRSQVIPAYRIGPGRTSGLRYLRSDLLEWLVRQRI
jgi:hypothetical protein